MEFGALDSLQMEWERFSMGMSAIADSCQLSLQILIRDGKCDLAMRDPNAAQHIDQRTPRLGTLSPFPNPYSGKRECVACG